ncbi:MAG: hypothetical protein WC714_18840 [Candidatus Obscuribacterales bacterium]|jgi:hypothetical protein
MSTASIIVIVVVSAIVAGLIFSPKFRQLFRIRFGKAVDAGTTALEKEKDQYNLLVARIPAQRDSVARTKAGAVIAKKKLGTLTDKLAAIEVEYKQADAVKAPADVVAAIEADYAATEAEIEAQKAIATEAAAVADEALKALEETTKALGKFKSRIEQDANKVDLKASLEMAAAARQELKDIQTEISGAGQASAEIDRALEEARAKNDMSKGSTTDQAREKLAEQVAANAGRDRLRSKLGMGTASSETAAPTETK